MAATGADGPQVVFIDSAVPDIDVLRAGLRPGIEAVQLSTAQPAAEQMAAALQARRDLASIHVIVHGRPGELNFAAGALSLETLAGHADALAAIGQALAADGDIKVWACHAAEGARGTAFLGELARAAKAPVRASTGRIGAASRGGGWRLDAGFEEGAAGDVAPPLTAQGMASWTGTLATFTATTGTDTFIGDGDDDTFVVSATNQIQAADIFDGGGGTDTLQIAATGFTSVEAAATNGVQGFVSIEALTFTDGSAPSIATFHPAQFGSGLISDNLTVTGVNGSVQSVRIFFTSAAAFSAAGWTFEDWESDLDGLDIQGLSGNDTIIGSSQADTLAGNGGVDTLTGGGGADLFRFNVATATALTFGGSGTSGTVSGYEVITDFAPGATVATSEELQFSLAGGFLNVAADTGAVDGIDSSLLLSTGSAVASHTITGGIVSFYADNSAAVPASLTSLSDVAAAAQYLQGNDLGVDGTSVAFRATIGGSAHTFVWLQSSVESMLLDLQNVSATGLSAGISILSVLDTEGPAAGALALDRLVDSTEIAGASFAVSGIEPGATAVASFTVGATTVTSGPLTAGGTYSIDLSSLADGLVTSSLTVTDSAGNATVSAGEKAIINNSTSLAIWFPGWTAWGAEEAAENDAFSTITITDKRARIEALTTTDIANLGLGGVTNVDSTNNTLSLTAAQYNAFLAAGIEFTAADTVVLLDTGAELATLLGTDLAGNGVDILDASDDALSMSLAQYTGLGTVALTRSDTVTLAGTGAGIAALDVTQIAALAADGIDIVDTTDDTLALSLARFNALGTVVVAGADALTVTGTIGDDRFSFTRQTFTNNDSVVGDAGIDTLNLRGNHTLVFGAGTLSGVEKMTLGAGSYVLTTDDANVAAGARLLVNGSRLGAADLLIFHGSAATDGTFAFRGGAGANGFTGGSGADTISGGSGLNTLFGGGGGDKIYGGGATDTIGFTAVADSTGAGYDTATGFDAAVDLFDLWDGATVAAMDSAITSGLLRSGAGFDAALEAGVDDTTLQANHAVLFTADAGNLAGRTFLVVDINGAAGYQAGQDLVVRLDNLQGTLGASNFV
ncbi:hypothetical protein BH10PSE6_BH10PSE6_06360 [soil metagenome]